MDLETRLTHLKNQLGLIGGSLEILPGTKASPVSAWINMLQWNVTLKVHDKWAPEKDKTLRKYISSYGLDPHDSKYLILADIIRHEARHWNLDRGCPCDLDYDFKINTSISNVLEDNGFKPDKKMKGDHPLTAHISNMFDDIVINTSNKFIHKPYIGLPIFFYEQGKDGGYGKIFDFFVKANLESFGEKEDFALVNKFLRKDVNVSSLIKKWGITKNLEQNVSILSNKSNWPKLAETFTTHLLPYIEKNQKQFPNLSYVRSFPDSKISPEAASDQYDDGGRIPGNVDRVEFLDKLYEGIAERIAVCSDTQRSKSYPLMDFGAEPFDFNKHRLSDIDTSRVYVDTESPFKKPITFSHKRYTHDIVLPVYETKTGYTDTCIMVDDSGSMMGAGKQETIPWGDDSEYHYAMLGFYGLMNYAKDLGIAPLVSWNLVRFSDTTKTSGWVDYSSLDTFKRQALDEVCGGGTTLDMKVVRKVLNRDPCNIILMSDDGIWNWGKIKDEFLDLAKPHKLAYLGMGKYTNGMGEDIRAAGHIYKHIENKSDLRNLMLSFVGDEYKMRSKST